jgi:hypothetical protein
VTVGASRRILGSPAAIAATKETMHPIAFTVRTLGVPFEAFAERPLGTEWVRFEG